MINETDIEAMKPRWYRKYYRCSNGHEWQDEWDCLCNDRCPECNEETEPYDHVEIDEGKPDEVSNYPLQSQDMTWVMFIRKDWLNASDLQQLSSQNQEGDNPDEGTDPLHPTTDP